MSHNLRHRWTRWGAVALLAALVALAPPVWTQGTARDSDPARDDYMTNSQASIQFITITARHLFDEYRADATDLLNGLTVR